MQADKKSLKQCAFNGCTEVATIMGHIYGHIEGSEESDSLIMVRACDIHAKRHDFFPNKPVCKKE